jgi:thiol-disulfide isomerase/thioredoxin
MPTINCPECRTKLKLDEEAGRKVVCPKCGARLRIADDGSVSVKAASAPKTDSFELPKAPAPRPRRQNEGLPGWAIYGVVAAVGCGLLYLIWQATSRATPEKPTSQTVAATGVDESPAAETPAPAAEPQPTRSAPPASDRPARKELHSSRKKESPDAALPPATGRSLARVTVPAEKSADAPSQPTAVPSPDGSSPPATKERAGKFGAGKIRIGKIDSFGGKFFESAPSSPAVSRVSAHDELTEALPGKLDDTVAQLVEQWQAASEKFAVEKAGTAGGAPLNALLKRDPAKSFGSQLVELGEKEAGKDAGFQAFLAAIVVVRDADVGLIGDVVARASKHLTTEHATDAGMGKVARLAAPIVHPTVRRLLQTVLDKSPQREDRGLAAYALVENLRAERDQSSESTALKRVDRQIAALRKRIDKDGLSTVSIDGQPLEDALKALAGSKVQPSVGSLAPEIVGKDLAGNRLKLSDYRGKVVMLEFWAGWCPHCRNLFPYQRDLVAKLQDQPFVLLGVNADKKAEAASLLRKKVTSWPSWQDGPTGPIAARYRISGYPTVFLIDRQGKIRYAGSATNWEFYDATIKNMLAESDKNAKDETHAASR